MTNDACVGKNANKQSTDTISKAGFIAMLQTTLDQDRCKPQYIKTSIHIFLFYFLACVVI